MPTYKTPGVYVEEVSLFPASIARVATAIPAFIGYTENDTYNGENLHLVPTKIKSLVEYEQIFGGEPTDISNRPVTVTLDSNFNVSDVDLSLTHNMYQSLRHFYANGGGDVYIVNVADYSDPINKDELILGLNALKKVDEPTLILTPDAFTLSNAHQGEVQAAVLAHCNNMQDRFGIFDVRHDSALVNNIATTDASNFRGSVGTQFLKYGAAYYPELETTLGPNGAFDLTSFTMQDESAVAITLTDLGTGSGDTALQNYNNALLDQGPLPNQSGVTVFDNNYTVIAETAAASAAGVFETELTNKITAIKSVMDLIYGWGNAGFSNPAVQALYTENTEVGGVLNTMAQELLTLDFGFASVPAASGAPGVIEATDYDGTGYVDAPNYALANPPAGIPADYGAPADVEAAVTNIRPFLQGIWDAVHGIMAALVDLVDAESDSSELFTTSKALAGILSAVRNTGYVLPPSGAIAGVYATVDRTRGVWKAPANISLNAVKDVTRKLSSSDLDDLNVPGDGFGKSINAIRYFRGKGVLVYGARTLAGNDNEWKYVPVRRLFIMVEESVKKASQAVVFEPNDANTWQKVKGSIENFLFGLWRDGALAGAVPEDAFYVKVGINETMTAEDILNGKLIIEIGMAAVRPAEFIILKFSHKLQES